MILLPDGRRAEFISESGSPEPASLAPIDDRARATVVLKMIQAGQVLLWTGDYRNGRTLIQTLRRRLNKERAEGEDYGAVGGAADEELSERWRSERRAVRERGEVLGSIMVAIEANGELPLRRAPDTREAVRLAWGASESPRVVALSTLVGSLGAAEWTKKGLDVPGLAGRITPRFGVFSPTRRAYVDLLEHLDVEGRSVLDVGTGTGVLAFVLLQRGAAYAVGTDTEERAVHCAIDNAKALGLESSYSAVQADLFPAGGYPLGFDCIVFNAPWVPETPRTALDRAVFDENGDTLRRFLNIANEHLTPAGYVALIVSDLPIRLGLRDPGALEAEIEAAGLRVAMKEDVAASHGRSNDPTDALHGARAAERIHLYVLLRKMG